jgi:hypothetical protein
MLQPKVSVLSCPVQKVCSQNYSINPVDLPIEYNPRVSSSPDEHILSAFAVALQSPTIPRSTPKTERAFQILKTAVQEFEQQYASRRTKAANSIEWDDDAITTALRQGTQGNVFEASIAFGKSIAATITKEEKKVEEETSKLSISGFIAKLFPLLKILLSVGETAAQVNQYFEM